MSCSARRPLVDLLLSRQMDVDNQAKFNRLIEDTFLRLQNCIDIIGRVSFFKILTFNFSIFSTKWSLSLLMDWACQQKRKRIRPKRGRNEQNEMRGKKNNGQVGQNSRNERNLWRNFFSQTNSTIWIFRWNERGRQSRDQNRFLRWRITDRSDYGANWQGIERTLHNLHLSLLLEHMAGINASGKLKYFQLIYLFYSGVQHSNK